jgi:hypothetical protein
MNTNISRKKHFRGVEIPGQAKSMQALLQYISSQSGLRGKEMNDKKHAAGHAAY